MYIYNDKGNDVVNLSSFHSAYIKGFQIRNTKSQFQKKNQYICFIKLLLSFNHQLVLSEKNSILVNNDAKFTQELKTL